MEIKIICECKEILDILNMTGEVGQADGINEDYQCKNCGRQYSINIDMCKK